jgi:hypothetical protein
MGEKEGKVKKIMLMFMVVSAILFSAARLGLELNERKIVMTDEKGYPLEDGFYSVIFSIYDGRDGDLIAEKTEVVESENGVCTMCKDITSEFEAKGYKEIWISTKIEDYPEPKYRTRIFLNPNK